MPQLNRIARGALAIGTLVSACSESRLTAPAPAEMPMNAVLEVLEKAEYHGPIALTDYVATDERGSFRGQQMLVTRTGREQLRAAFKRNPQLRNDLAVALNALQQQQEVDDPELIDANHNTRTADLGSYVFPSVLNIRQPVQSQITFTNRFYSYDEQNDRWYVVASGTVNSSTVEARDSTGGHYHGAVQEQRSTRQRVGYMQPSQGSISASSFTNTWFAPEFAQEVNFVYNVTEIGGPNAGETNDFYSLEATATRRTGLSRLPAGASHDRVGGTVPHPEAFNDWGDAGLVQGIINFANAYNRQTGDRTRVNDMGLFFGGRFDLDANWARTRGSHAEHRGNEVDNRPYAMTDARKRATYGRLLSLYFATWIFERNPPHYHARSASSLYR